MDSLFEGVLGTRLRQGIFVAVVLFCVFLTVIVIAQVQGLRYIGAGVTASNTINVSGYGESFAVPDIATFTFTVQSEKPTVTAAQTEATTQINAITKYLADAGIDKKDIQTTDYNVYPQYDYTNGVCTNGYCPPGKQVLRGYQVSQTTTVKVRDTTKAGDLLAGVGDKGATQVSGLTFTFDDPQLTQDEARNKAIADAKKKADELAKQLGVSIVRVVSFSESTGGRDPIYYAKDMTMGTSAVAPQAAPEISIGQNKVTSNVSVTYEIR